MSSGPFSRLAGHNRKKRTPEEEFKIASRPGITFGKVLRPVTPDSTAEVKQNVETVNPPAITVEKEPPPVEASPAIQAEEKEIASSPTTIFEKAAPTHDSGFLAEVKENLEIASRPWSGELISFSTREWDNGRKGFTEILPDMQKDLTQAYTDIRLANNIVWLAQELGRRTTNMEEGYQKLCERIASHLGRLGKIACTKK